MYPVRLAICSAFRKDAAPVFAHCMPSEHAFQCVHADLLSFMPFGKPTLQSKQQLA